MRLTAGVPAAVATQRIAALVRAGLPGVAADWTPILTSQQDAYTMTVRPMLWAVAVSAGLILLIAAANVAVLMLIRGRQREKELAVRVGARRDFRPAGVAARARECGHRHRGHDGRADRARRSRCACLGASFERFLERRVPGGLDAFAVDGLVLAGAVLFGMVVTILATLAPLVAMRSRAACMRRLTQLSRAATDAPAAGPHAIAS